MHSSTRWNGRYVLYSSAFYSDYLISVWGTLHAWCNWVCRIRLVPLSHYAQGSGSDDHATAIKKPALGCNPQRTNFRIELKGLYINRLSVKYCFIILLCLVSSWVWSDLLSATIYIKLSPSDRRSFVFNGGALYIWLWCFACILHAVDETIMMFSIYS